MLNAYKRDIIHMSITDENIVLVTRNDIRHRWRPCGVVRRHQSYHKRYLRFYSSILSLPDGTEAIRACECNFCHLCTRRGKRCYLAKPADVLPGKRFFRQQRCVSGYPGDWSSF